jgi:sec-independent protein translocase protein TatA
MLDGLFANPLHWVILLVVVLIMFGPGKLPGVGSALGKSLREFKRATQEDGPDSQTSAQNSYQTPALITAATGTHMEACAACGHENSSDARYCGSCGATLGPVEPIAASPPITSVTMEPLRCPGCQTENPGSNQFCAHCGKLLEQSMQRV